MGGSLPAKGRKLEVAFFAINNTTKNNNKRSPLSTSASAASLRPARWGLGARVPRRRGVALRPPGRGRGRPCSLFFFLLFLFFFFLTPSCFPFSLATLYSVRFFFFSFFIFLSGSPPTPPPAPSLSLPAARPSVGEDQVGDAGLQPVSRDHLAHLGRAVVRELEVRAGAGFEVKIQIPVQRRRRAEAAQGHALKV